MWAILLAVARGADQPPVHPAACALGEQPSSNPIASAWDLAVTEPDRVALVDTLTACAA